MNWTGGRLQRSKNANRGISQKQKAHFARARTQLQNNTAASMPVFPSDSFLDEAVSLHSQLPLCNARTARLTGHRTTLQGHDKSRETSPVRHERPGTRDVVKRRPLHGHDHLDSAALGNTNSIYHLDRSTAANDSKEDLMEAKRKTLLQQMNWAGLARPNLRVMKFKAQGRDKIGKRRKTSHQNALTIREGRSRLVPRHVQAGASHPPGQDSAGAHRNHDISIRIGIEALTEGTSVQTSPQAQAAVTSNDASSDNILLDNDALHIVAPKPGQHAVPNARRFVGAPTHAHNPWISARGATPRSQQLCYGGNSMASVRADRNGGSRASSDNRSIDNPSEDNVSANEKGEVSKACITHQLESVAHPLRLTFDTATKFSAAAPVDNASLYNLIGESNHDHFIANAAVIESGNVHMEAKVGSAEPGAPRSIDNGPWVAFLPTQADTGSSELSTADSPPAPYRAHDRRSLLPLSGSADTAPWSQQATRGARTLGNASLCVSPSLPSITREIDADELRKRPHLRAEWSGLPKKQRDENDEFWQRLVFGSDQVDSADGFLETTTSPAKVAERRIPSSVAVSRSSTPFDPLCGPGSCVSERTPAATTRAPLVTSSGSMFLMTNSSIVPLSPCGQSEGLRRESVCGDAVLTEDEGPGLQSATHTSMQANLSYASDAGSSIVPGDSARATRSELDREEGCKNDHVGPARATKREMRHQPNRFR